MLRRNLLTALLLTSILFYGCTADGSTSTEPVSVIVENISEIEDINIIESEITTEQEDTKVEESTSEYSSEEIKTTNETGELNNVIIEIEGNIATVNGREYEIATDEMNYSGGYMYYYIGNTAMEDIVAVVNTGDLTKTYWREGFVKELQEEAAKDTQLEEFIEAGGTILNYYILNSNRFISAYEYGEVPIAVEYSINGEIYGTIITFCIVSERSEEDVYYGINQVIHTDNLDAYHVYDN